MGAALKLVTPDLDLRRDMYKGISLLFQLTFALDGFYQEPYSINEKAPSNWNPIFLHYFYGILDPYMCGSQIMCNPDESKLFEPWNNPNGIERTRLFLKEVACRMKETKYHINENIPNDVPDFCVTNQLISDKCAEYIMSTHFITTREVLTRDSIIIGFFHLQTSSFKRYLIKDVKKLCRVLRVFNGDFELLLGRSGKCKSIEYIYDLDYNKNTTKEEFDSKISKLIFDASSYRIKNEHVLLMLRELRGNKNNVYYLNN